MTSTPSNGASCLLRSRNAYGDRRGMTCANCDTGPCCFAPQPPVGPPRLFRDQVNKIYTVGGENRPPRHPVDDDGFDIHKDAPGCGIQPSLLRLRYATDFADERAPEGMSLVWRLDLLRLWMDWVHKSAAFPLWRRDRAANAQLVEQNQRYRAALERIERWEGEFPETGRFWDGDPQRPMSYSAAFGSNGERDFMRGVARAATAGSEAPELAESADVLAVVVDEMQERLLFEDWKTRHSDRHYTLERDDAGDYVSYQAQEDWRTWMASRTVSRVLPDNVDEG